MRITTLILLMSFVFGAIAGEPGPDPQPEPAAVAPPGQEQGAKEQNANEEGDEPSSAWKTEHTPEDAPVAVKEKLFSVDWETLSKSKSRIGNEVIPVDKDRFPTRPRPPIEWGDKILGQGTIGKGFVLPTGAVWQPSLWAFGNMRMAVQSFDGGAADTVSEAVTRADIFTQLRLTGTERIVIGMRPFDDNGFTRYQFAPDNNDGGHEELNTRIRTFYAEGDFAELFPRAGRNGNQPKQLGFVLGRQPLVIQEGMMINDVIDGFGITRNNIPVKGTSNFRISGFFGWDNIGRNDNVEDRTAKMLGVFTEWDAHHWTYNIDMAFVEGDHFDRDLGNGSSVFSGGDGLYVGISRRANKGRFNTNYQLNFSWALDQESAQVSDGVLFFSEISWYPYYTHDILYFNTFIAVDEYASASRGPSNGGPMGRTGLMFRAVGMSAFGPPMGNKVNDDAGLSFGWQHFFNVRRQIVIELGARDGIQGSEPYNVALGTRFEQALGQHFLIRLDGFYTLVEDGDDRSGIRTEIQLKF